MKSYAIALALLTLTHAAHAADEVKFRTSFETSGTILRNIVNEACIDGVVYLVFQSQNGSGTSSFVSTAVTPKIQSNGKPVTCSAGQNLRN